jgi:hypothetical protein
VTKVPRGFPRPNQPDDDPPPILRSWGRWYLAVLIHLFLWIALFYTFTLEFDRIR